MDDDFNTAGAMGALFSLVGEANVYLEKTAGAVDAAAARACADAVEGALGVLGVELPQAAEEVPAEVVAVARDLAGYAGEDAAEAAEALLARRAAARAAKDWASADAIRDALAQAGLTVEDTPQGARVKKRS